MLDPWGPILGVLFEDQSSDYILGALQRAGVPTGFSLTQEESHSHATRKRTYLRRLDSIYSELEPAARHRVAKNLAHEMAKSEHGLSHLNAVLERIGWVFQNGDLTLLSRPVNPAVSEGWTPEQVSKAALLTEVEDLLKAIPPRATIRHETQENRNWFGRASAAIGRWDPSKSVAVEEHLGLFFSNRHVRETAPGLTKLLVLLEQAQADLRLETSQMQPLSNARQVDHDQPQSSRVKDPIKVIPARKIFIVHGHDTGSREAVARFVEKMGFEAIILQEQANQGMTIIEKVDAHGDVGFAIVLLTPDDIGSKAGGSLQPRPRQNVLVELGYFIGRLGRANVCALATSNTMELPTDFAGVVWEPFDQAGAWKAALIRELHAAGFDIDFKKATLP